MADRQGVTLAAILLFALALRLRNIDHGLPLVFDIDEHRHFVRPALQMFDSALNPHYFQNPSALTDLFHLIFRFGFRQGAPFGESGLLSGYRADPTSAFVAARVAVALIGTLAVWLVFALGARCFDRRTGLIAAALLAVAFLPYRYSTLALPDVPLLAAVAAATLAALRALERGRRRDFALAGAAAGLAIAVKYLALPVLGLVVIAAALRRRDGATSGRCAVRDAGVAIGVALAVFGVLNPYAVLDFAAFRSQVGAQARVGGLLGQEDAWGPMYYMWTLTHGLGWAPLVAAAAGLVLALRAERRRAVMLVAYGLALFAIVALAHPRLYGRYLLGAYPALCVLAAYGAVRLVDALGLPRAAALAATVAATAILCTQGLLDSLRVSSQLGRDDTRTIAARWLAAHVPEGAGLALEPLTPPRLFDVRRPGAKGRYRRYPAQIPPGQGAMYARYLTAERVEHYRRTGFCHVVVTSHQKERALKAGLRGARAYYARLAATSARTVTITPYRRGAAPVKFSYDASYDGRSRAFRRPGPVVEIHRLRECQLASGRS